MWWHECHVGNVGHIGYVGACSHHFTSFLKVVSTLPYHRLWLAATVHMQWGLTVVWHRLGRAPMAGWVTEDPRMSQTSGTSAHCKVLWHACQVCTAMPSSHGHTWQCSHFVLSQQSWFWVDGSSIANHYIVIEFEKLCITASCRLPKPTSGRSFAIKDSPQNRYQQWPTVWISMHPLKNVITYTICWFSTYRNVSKCDQALSHVSRGWQEQG